MEGKAGYFIRGNRDKSKISCSLMRRFVIIPARCESFLASGSRSVTKGKIVEREILWIELFTMEFFFLLYFWLMYYQSIRWEREGISIIFINFWHFRNIEVIFMVDNFENNVTDPWYFNLRNFFLPYTEDRRDNLNNERRNTRNIRKHCSYSYYTGRY